MTESEMCIWHGQPRIDSLERKSDRIRNEYTIETAQVIQFADEGGQNWGWMY